MQYVIVIGWKQAESRMVHMRERMVERGIAADALQPQWCHQNEALCYVKKNRKIRNGGIIYFSIINVYR